MSNPVSESLEGSICCLQTISGYEWISNRSKSMDEFSNIAFIASREDDDDTKVRVTSYVAQGFYEGHLLPGELRSLDAKLIISYGGQQKLLEKYNVLCEGFAQLTWIDSSDGIIPDDAIKGGFMSADSGGEQQQQQQQRKQDLYIGRYKYMGQMCIGRIDTICKCLVITFQGREIKCPSYQVLCCRNK